MNFKNAGCYNGNRKTFSSLLKASFFCCGFLFLSLVTLASLSFAESQPAGVRYGVVSAEVLVKGESTLHDWEMKGSSVSATLSLPNKVSGSDALRSLSSTAVKLEVQIPVKSLKSDKSGLDDNAYKALNEKKFPNIAYLLSTVKLLEDSTESEVGSGIRFDTNGRLAIAGNEKEINFTVTTEVVENGQLKVSLKVPLKMSDFKVEPPSFMMGMISAEDEVEVEINAVFESIA